MPYGLERRLEVDGWLIRSRLSGQARRGSTQKPLSGARRWRSGAGWLLQSRVRVESLNTSLLRFHDEHPRIRHQVASGS